MKKIGYILAAVYAVFSLSVTSLAAGLVEDAEDAVDTVADGLEDALDGEDDPADSSDTGAGEDDPADSSDTGDGEDEPGESSDTEADVSTPADTTTAAIDSESGSAGGAQNPATGVVLGCTALGLATAGLTAAAARRKK